MAKWVYGFGAGKADGDASMKALLGGKGANLAEMCGLGLAVPPGLTITTEVCSHYYANGKGYPSELEAEVQAALKKIEQTASVSLGDPKNPLLLSVRSGSPLSMPGMMDTVLNLGLNDETVEGLAAESRRCPFRQGQLSPLHPDVSATWCSASITTCSRGSSSEIKRDRGYKLDTELTADDLADLITRLLRRSSKTRPASPFRRIRAGAALGCYRRRLQFLDDPSRGHLQAAARYRRGDWGTAVNVQAMVFGKSLR